MIESEVWTRELLRELRLARYRPRGWLRFLGASLARAREQRQVHPHAHRQLLALAAAGALAWSAAAVAGRPALAVAGAGWWLAQALMVDWHLGLLSPHDGGRAPGLGIANVLTMLRGGLPPALFVLADAHAGVALLGLAVALDLADGPLARRRGEASRLGFWLDGSVDTTVLAAAALGATVHGRLAAWSLALVLARLALPWFAAAAVYFVGGVRPPEAVPAERVASLAAGALVLVGLAFAFLGRTGANELAGGGAVGGTVAFLAAAYAATRSPSAASRISPS